MAVNLAVVAICGACGIGGLIAGLALSDKAREAATSSGPLVSPHDSVVEGFRLTAKNFEGKLPQDIDGTTTLTEVTAADMTLRYVYRMSFTLDPAGAARLLAYYTDQAKSYWCLPENRFLMDNGGRVSYRLIDAGSTSIGEFQVAACQPLDDPQKG